MARIEALAIECKVVTKSYGSGRGALDLGRHQPVKKC